MKQIAIKKMLQKTQSCSLDSVKTTSDFQCIFSFSIHSVAPRRIIIRQGHVAENFYFVLSGNGKKLVYHNYYDVASESEIAPCIKIN